MVDWADLDEVRQIELLRRDVALEIEARKHQYALHQINAKGVLDLVQGALRSFILVNGGAIVALLTFIGNRDVRGVSQDLWVSLMSFSGGLGFGLASTALAYLAQLNLTYGIPITDGENRASYIARRVAIYFTTLSMGGFASGVWFAGRVLI